MPYATISPGRASHVILALLRDAITLYKLEHGRADVPMKDANDLFRSLSVHPARPGSCKVHALTNETLGRHRDAGYEPPQFGYELAIERMIIAGLIHRRYKWRSHDGQLMAPDYTITDLGMEALDILDAGGFYILWYS